MVPEVLYGKGLVQKYLLDDMPQTETTFAQVIAEYPNHPITLSALAEAQQPVARGQAKMSGETDAVHPWNASVVVAPNPYDIRNRGQALQFFHLPTHARILVYDVAGRQRLQTTNEGATADLPLDASRYSARVYLYVVEELDGAQGAPTGKRTTGKFVVVQ